MIVQANVIEGAYLKDILDQPKALNRCLAELARNGDEIRAIARELSTGRYKRIVLTGMGSSLFALYGLHLRLISSGFASILVETSELIHYLSPVLDAATLLIAVSQSGRSAEVVRLVEMIQGKVMLLGVTNDAESSLGMASDVRVLLQAGPESTVSCKTYVCSLLALQWLGTILTQQDARGPTGLFDLVSPAVEAYLSDWSRHVAEITPLLTGIRQIFVTARGASVSTALTGGLILKESARFSAEGMSCAAFRHGPFEMLSSSVFVLVMEGDSRSANLNRKLVEDVIAARGRAALVSNSAADGGAFRVPFVADALQPIVEILPVQMISLALAALADREAGRFELATKVTGIE